MEKPKTWLSAIVRENGLYVQAFIFSCDNGYIANSHIVLTNKKNNKSTIYQMASGDETCLFKYVNKLTPDVSTDYSIKLVVNAYIYSESDIIKFLDTVEFTTPDSWREDVGGDYAVTIEPIVAVGKLSTKPTVKSVISGGEFKDGMRLRICAVNSLSTTLDYNSFDAMADFALEDGIYVYNNIFGLGVSGKWYFKAFLALQNNNIISTSNTFEYNVNQGDIEIENLIVGDNVSVVESRMRSKSSEIELYDIKVDYYLGKVDRIRVDLIRKSDNVSVAFVESVDISDLVLQYKEPFTTNTIEISVKYEYKFIMDGDENGYYAFINEISTNKLTMQDEYMIRVYGI